MDRKLIKSVLGFNLKADIRDEYGQVIATGVRSSIFPKHPPLQISYRVFDKSFFTSFDEDLLAKIRQHRRLND